MTNIALDAILNLVTHIISVAEVREAVVVLMTDEILYAAVTVADARITVAAIIVVWEMLDLSHTV